MLWANEPGLALRNALWHVHFLLWPLALLGLHKCGALQKYIDRGISLSLMIVALWFLVGAATGWPWLAFEDAGTTHPGILAQETLVLGIWMLLALTRPVEAGGTDRMWHVLGVCAAPVVLIASGRRLELLGYLMLLPLFLLIRFRSKVSTLRLVLALLVFVAVAAALVYVRREKFLLGFSELSQYFAERELRPEVVLSSWGARLEMYRVGIMGFLDHPILGMSAGVRPYLLTEYNILSRQDFGHRHFHSQLLQTLIEGGLLGLVLMVSVMVHSIRLLIIKAWSVAREPALLALALYLGYMIEGAFSAALTYGEANAMFVVASAWLWLQIRKSVN
ncbi:O-antigen ligase [Limnohabitans sp. T6-5]|uniref:O-antigen ligase family protein n=1 Tax=Limnohabitans sp. T6-5 TaxID=1100724 RepID=UPI001304EC81|nr:O-antigen ligase family protein [Limnohabitans sp. T6-5]